MTKEAITIFFSYSHQDEKFKDELVKHLSILRRQNMISEWHDRMIKPGSEWDREINAYLSSADIILLMVSPDFLYSEYCWGVEVQKAIERHEVGEAQVIPVVLRRVIWEGAPFAKLQALPKNAEPIANWEDQDAAYYDVAQGIRSAVLRLRAIPKQRLGGDQQLVKSNKRKAKEFIRKKVYELRLLMIELLLGNRKVILQTTWQIAIAIQVMFGVVYAVGWLVYLTVSSPFYKSFTQASTQEYEFCINEMQSCTALWMGKAKAEDFINRAYFKARQGYSESALDDFDKAVKLKPNQASTYYELGNAHDNLGDKGSALEAYDKAIKLDPTYVRAYYERGNVRFALGDKEDALADYDKAIELSPYNTKIYYQRGLIRSEMGDEQGAIADYKQAIKFQPSFVNAYDALILIYRKQKNNKRAVTYLNQAIQLQPTFAYAHYKRGLIYKEQGEKQRAITDFKNAAYLYQQQYNSVMHQEALAQLKELQP